METTGEAGGLETDVTGNERAEERTTAQTGCVLLLLLLCSCRETGSEPSAHASNRCADERFHVESHWTFFFKVNLY